MRRKLFDWHLTLGYGVAFVMIVWSVSGAAMILDPLVRRAADGSTPVLRPEGLNAADYAYPVSQLPLDGSASVSLRRLGGRAWYEAKGRDGKVRAFDARTGAPVSGESPADEVRAAVSGMLAGSAWSVRGLTRVDGPDDHYRNGEYPAYRVALDGPSGVELYVSARDAAPLKTTTRMSRFFRWLGMGVHTWNLQAFKSSADAVRRWSLALLIALPVGGLAILSLVLFSMRKKALAAAVALAVAAAPVQAAIAPRAPASAVRPAVRGVPVRLAAPPRSSSFQAAPGAASGSFASVPAMPGAFAGVPDAPRAEAAREAGVPLAADAAAPRDASAATRDGRRSSETDAAEAGLRFDASVLRDAEEVAPVMGVDGGRTVLAAGGSGAAVPRAEPPAPGGPKKPSAMGIYVTHAVHLLGLSAGWRVAWPILALQLVGGAGLAFIGSTAALAEMVTGLISGVVVDRLLPRRSMALAAVTRAGITLALMAALHAGAGVGLPFLFGAFLANSLTLTATHLAQSAAAPRIAGSDSDALRRINSVLKIITAAVSIPGALLGGFLVAQYGGIAVLAGYAALNLIVLAPLALWLIPKLGGSSAAPAEAAAPADKTGLWRAAKMVFTNPILIAALIAMAAGVVLAEPLRSTTLPILADGLNPGSAAMLLGGFQAAFYAGQLAGSAGLIRWGKRLSNRSWLLVGASALGAFWLFTLAPLHVGFAFAATAVVGLLSQLLSIVAKTVFQDEVRRVAPDLLGRAMAVNNVVYRLTVAVGTALVGWAAASALLGAAGTLAAVYTGVGLLLVGAVLRLMKPAGAKSSWVSVAALTAALVVGAVAAVLVLAPPLSLVQWHGVLGMLAGPVILWMAATGAITIAGPLLKKLFDPELPSAPEPEGFGSFTLSLADAELALSAARPDFKPVSAVARRGAGRAWYEFEDASGALSAVDAADGRAIDPLITAAEAAAAAQRWLEGSRWTPAGAPVLLAAYDEQYRKGELPAYRIPLSGPGRYDAYLSARDGRPTESLSALARSLRWAGIGMHTFGFGLFKTKLDSARRVAMPLLIALPILLLAVLGLLSRLS